MIKCPLNFSSLKNDFQVLQIGERTNTNIDIKNVSSRSIIFELFLPMFEICGLKLTPMVGTIEPNGTVEINIEYASFFKKLGPFTLEELREK